jgi:hypothetical protein
MRRRDFGKTSLAALGASLLANTAKAARNPEPGDFPKTPGLTKYVAEFVVRTKYEDIPGNVL